MKTRRLLSIALLACVGLGSVGCGGAPKDYTLYQAKMPRSVLVLPPVNHTTNLDASDVYLATISRPLAERGYYVFPPAVVNELFKANGMPTPGDMHNVSLAKVKEILGADAVLYVDILEWQTQYIVLSADSRVTLRYRLVDVASGDTLWEAERSAYMSQGGLSVEGLAAAAAHKATSERNGLYRDLAARANGLACTGHEGLLVGPLSPQYVKVAEMQTASR